MKKLIYILIAIFSVGVANAQSNLFLLTVKDMKGRMNNVSNYIDDQRLTVFVFWKTCCPNNLAMLSNLTNAIEDDPSIEEKIKFVLVSQDDARNVSRVKPVVATYDWKSDVIMDGNQDFARKVNVMTSPQWLVVNSNQEEVLRCKITSSANDVEIFLEKIMNLNK